MKRIYAYILILILPILLCSCGQAPSVEVDGFSIVAVNFPAYDFAHELTAGKANIVLLVPPGSEAHSFEPTPQDILRIESCDLLICNGGESESWLEEILSGLNNNVSVISMLECVEALEEEIKEGMQDLHEHHENHEEEHTDECYEHEAEYDEHVWTSPVNAQLISRKICAELCRIDKENTKFYTDQCGEYCTELSELDSTFRSIVHNSTNKNMIFADRFPVRYFTEEYGLDYYAAFPGCAEDTEPSAKTVAYLIDRVREYHTPAVFYIEFSNEKMADIICEDTGCEKRLFHSCHNVSAEQFKNGVSYLELMKCNAENLKEALN